MRAEEGIHEIEFEPVQIPLDHGLLINVDQVFTDLRKARIEYGCAHLGIITKVLAGKSGVRLRFNANKRHGIPEYKIQTLFMHSVYKRPHITDAFGLPITAIGIKAAGISGLPAIIHNDGAAAEFFGESAFAHDLIRL